MFPSARKAISEKEQGLSTRSLWKFLERKYHKVRNQKVKKEQHQCNITISCTVKNGGRS